MASVRGSLPNSTKPASKRKRKGTKRDEEKPIEHNSITPAFLNDGRSSKFGKHRIGEPATKKTKLDLDRRSLNPVIEFDELIRPSESTSTRLDNEPDQARKRLEKMSGAVKTLLECMGEDPFREGLLATPLRYAKALLFFTKGYRMKVENVVNGAIFHEEHKEMVIVKNIEIYSLCEHHLVPFTGKVYVIQIHIPLLPEGN